MEDTLQIPTQTMFQDDPPLKKLWKGLYADKKYTKSFDEFKTQYSTPEAITKLHAGLNADGDYTKSIEDFQKQYFPEVKKKSILPSSSADTRLPSQKKLVGTVTVGEAETIPPPIVDPIDLSSQINKLENEKQDITTNEGVKGTPLIRSQVPQENIDAAKKLRAKLNDDYGVSADEIYKETGRLTPEDYQRIPKEQLYKDRQENNPFYQREVGHLNWTRDFGDKLKKSVEEGLITPEQDANVRHAVQESLSASSVGNYEQQRSNINTVAGAIKNFGGADSDKILKDYAVEVSKVYGSSFLNGFDKAKEDTPEGKYLPTPEAQLGYQYIKDVDPERAKQYERLFIDPKTLKDKPDELKGYNHFMQTLEETGIGLQQNAITEELNNLNNIAKKNDGLSPDQMAQAEKLQTKNEELNRASKDLEFKYPDKLKSKIDDAMQEIYGQDMGYGRYAMGKIGLGLQHTAQGIWEGVSTPFMTPEDNSMRELALMGQKIDEEDIYHITDKNKNFLTDKLVIKPELQSQIDAIKNDKSLTKEQQQEKTRLLLRDNSDKFGRVNIEGGKLNISPSSILYGVTDIGASLLPFIALETATGGGATAGAVQKFMATFSAAAATGFHDVYSDAIAKGKSQSEAYQEAMGITAINSFAMAGAGTAEAVRAMAGTKTSAGKLISQMSDEAIEAVIKKGAPKGMKAVLSAIKDRVLATPKMVAEGLKSGAKFELAMTGAKEAEHQAYNTPIDREQNFKQSLLGIANFGILGAGLGHLGYKDPTELQKSSLIEFGKKPEEYTALAEDMHKDGKLSSEELDHRKMLIEKSAEAYKVLPKANDKGKPLSEKDKADYLHETVIMNEGYKASKTLPPKQAEKAEMTALVADHKRDFILNPQPVEKLTKRKEQLEKSLIPKQDAEGKNIEIPEKEIFAAKAEIKAIDEVLDESKKIEVPEAPKVKGEPENISQPIELNVNNESAAPTEETTQTSVTGNEPVSTEEKSQPDENVNIKRAKEIANGDTIQGYSAAPLKEAANNNPEEFNSFLKNIAEQSQDPKSKTEAIKAYGQELVDIANELHPPKEPPPPTGEGTVGDSGEDFELTKMANAVNDAHIEGKFGNDALQGVIDKLQDTNLKNIYEKVKGKIEKGVINLKNLRERLITTKSGSEEDQAALMYDLADLKNKEASLQKEIINETNSAKIKDLQSQLLDVQNDMMDNALANRVIGRTASSIFRLRQLWVNREKTIVDMVEEYKASKGIKELTPEQEAHVKERFNIIQEARQKLEAAKMELERAREENVRLKEENDKLQELQGKATTQKKADRKIRSDEAIAKSKERISKSVEDLKKLRGGMNDVTRVIPKVALAISKIAAEKVYQGIVKFDELVKNVFDEVKGAFPEWTEKDVANHILAKFDKDGNQIKSKVADNYLNAKSLQENSNKNLREKVKAYEAAQKEVALKQFEWQKDRRMDMMQNRTVKERVIDSLLRWQRFAVLSYPSTFVKLLAVVGHQLLLKAPKFALQKGVYELFNLPKRLSGGKLMNPLDKAAIWGNPTWRALGKYYSTFIRNFALTNLKEQFKGIDTKEMLYGKAMMYDEWNAAKGLLEMPGRSHGYIKSFIKNPEFQFAHEQQMTYNISKMAEIQDKLSNDKLTDKEKDALKDEYAKYDVTNEDVMERVNKLSLEHGKWAILMNDNKFVDKFRKWTGETGITGALLKSEAPILKIPINYVGRAFATKYGLIQALIGKGKDKMPSVVRLMFHGTKDLTEPQAELLGRVINLGSMGAAFFTLGYLNRNNVKVNDDGSIEFFGIHISKNIAHVPEYESFFSGAETGRGFDKSKDKDVADWIKSFVESDIDIAKKSPFTSMLKYGFIANVAGALLDTKNKDKTLGKVEDAVFKKVADMLIPGFLKQGAGWGDTKEPGIHPMGVPKKRYPTGNELERFWQTIELGIPKLRENVPEKKSGRR